MFIQTPFRNYTFKHELFTKQCLAYFQGTVDNKDDPKIKTNDEIFKV